MLESLGIRWAFNVAALFVAAWILPGISYGNDWWSLLIAAIVVTLGIFYFLINVLMLYLTDWLVSDFQIDTFWWAVLGAIIVSLVNGVLHMIFGDPTERRQREP